MDAHSNDSGSEGGGIRSNRERRKQQMQKKQQDRKQADSPGATAPTDSIATAGLTGPDGASRGPGDGWAHDEQPPMTGPCKVEYCPSKLDQA